MSVVYESKNVALLHGDSREELKSLPDNCVDSVVTDPPYELGFMNKGWDSSGIAYDLSLWREVLRVLKPGGHLMAFGGTRTYHRMTCAIEDAGFEIRDSLHWIYGSGFPKSLNVGDGRGTALKPAHEPIVLARKPLAKGLTIAANVIEHGTGALNIDGSRIARGAGDRTEYGRDNPLPPIKSVALGDFKEISSYKPDEGGRWPANILHDDSVDLPPFFYCAKASRSERDRNLEHLPAKSAGEATDRDEDTAGLNSPRAGAGRKGGARNFHPTVKPIELMKWCVRLITPPGGTVLDPFSGSGSTLVAATELGFNAIGVELTAEYLPIILGRLGVVEGEAA